MLQCLKSEVKTALIGTKKTHDRPHRSVPKNCTNIRRTYGNNKDTFLGPKIESGVTSRSAVSGEESISCGFKQPYAYDEQDGPHAWRTRDHHKVEAAHTNSHG